MMKKESGYAWFVVFCSFALHFITDGVSYTFGIFFSEFSDEFKSTKVAGAWVPSIMTGVTYGIGPVASALTNKYGCRAISITGTTFVAVGFLLSTFATNVRTLYFTIGILAGTGFGLIYLPAIVIITQYFNRRLALATGLAVSASGIGSALFAPITEYLIEQLGWRYAMQTVSLILFASGLFGLSFKTFTYDNESTDSEECTSEDSFNDEIMKQKIVKFNQKDDSRNETEEEKLMKNNLDKFCNDDDLTKNKVQLSENSLNSVTSNTKHNRIINNQLNKQTSVVNLESELGERDEQEMLIPIAKLESEHSESSYDRYGNIEPNNNIRKEGENEEKNEMNQLNSNLNVGSNLLTNNLTISLNTNLNNLNNVSRPNEIPRLSLDSSANYRLQHQLQQHHHHLQQLKENQMLRKQLTNVSSDQFSSLIDESNLQSDNARLATVQSPKNLKSPNDQIQYNSYNSLHQNMPILNSQLGSNLRMQGSNLNTIVLYSTSMTSINYCCPELNVNKGENVNSKHNSISSHKLSNVLTTPLQHEKLGVENKNVHLITKKYSTSGKPNYFRIRRSTLDTILNVRKYISVLLCWNLLRDRIFLWFAISNFLTSLGYNVPYIYIKEVCLVLPEMANEKPSNCSYLLSLIGFSSTVGRILFGFLSDFKQFNRIYIYAHCLTLCGLSTIFSMFSHHYYILAIYSAVFGLTTGAFVSLTTVIIVDLLGNDRVSNAFGLLLLFQGVASLTGPPIVGLLYDYTSSYTAGFTSIGVFIVTSGAMLYLIPCLKKI